MSMKGAVASFLNNFKEKMKIWDVLFRDDRGKNAKTLAELELRPIERKNVLEALEEKLYGGADMWIFGRIIKKKEVYIKIALGVANSGVICISFHLAEHKMNYPLK